MLVERPRARCGAASGISAVELLTVIAIVAVLLGMAAPGFQALIARQRIAAATSDLHSAILLARSEAIKRGRRVDLAPSGKGDDWNAGWVVYIDANRNGIADAGDAVIHRHGPLDAPLGLVGAFTDSSHKYLAYQGSGRTRIDASDQVPQIGSFRLSLEGKVVREIRINFSGRPRICDPDRDAGC